MNFLEVFCTLFQNRNTALLRLIYVLLVLEKIKISLLCYAVDLFSFTHFLVQFTNSWWVLALDPIIEIVLKVLILLILESRNSLFTRLLFV